MTRHTPTLRPTYLCGVYGEDEVCQTFMLRLPLPIR